MTTQPDIFRNVHKGIRAALFEACTALGRAGADPTRTHLARTTLKNALTFVAQHGDNEDVLLVPIVEHKVPDVAARMKAAHGPINAALQALRANADQLSMQALYDETADFTALYLAHISQEEREFEPRILATLSAEELMRVGQQSVERTPAGLRPMMLRWTAASVTKEDAADLLSRLPAALADDLRGLVA